MRSTQGTVMLHVGSGRVSARCGSLVRVATVVVSASVLTPLLVPVVSAVANAGLTPRRVGRSESDQDMAA